MARLNVCDLPEAAAIVPAPRRRRQRGSLNLHSDGRGVKKISVSAMSVVPENNEFDSDGDGSADGSSQAADMQMPNHWFV